MPGGCCTPDYDTTFDERAARRELAAYRRSGPGGTTRRLIGAVREQGIAGASVLDIGAGVGIVGIELLAAGASRLTDVDAARAYLAAARSEVERRGFADRATFVHGDFVAVSAGIEPADVVALDRVICCYRDWGSLVDVSTERARRIYGLVYPRDRWWMRLAIRAENAFMALRGRRFRFYVHPEAEVDARVRDHGFRRVAQERGLAWQTVLYVRAS